MPAAAVRPQLTSVGSYNVDYYIVVDRLPMPGETLKARELYVGHGGKGSNQAVSAARLGASARLIAAVGNDEEGREALRFLSSEGVDASGVSVKPARTGRAYIIVGGGQNMIVVDPGANSMLSEEDVLRSLPRGGALMASLEVPLSAVRAALEAFNGVRVLNPAPATPEARDLARLADVITPNEVEALQLTGASSPAEAAERLLELVPAVVITLGERGALVAERGRGKAIIEAPRVEAVDPTGAGDAFNAALAHSLACGLDLVEATSVAVRAASYKVTRKGALGLRASELLSLGLEIPCSR
ncbi:2-Keto-3-deoxy-gluconate kinase (KDGK) [Acidilobus saccharovorans 345-15]|uniref:Ribokinase n=1 Tax=Acidilobus saccharovorans (strain DSM 16705 / JCM 18335 / VKM B-2471 / 345-15) TaxID=666510 RepID=D9Q1D1_ACIS3|nr:ribokinase [Acidilobus saccharovorans]ADL19119.1 2-Keto-3-deoxy-gluconate kinase (KDGK) [Acidilobus saccharovorans 345-15]